MSLCRDCIKGTLHEGEPRGVMRKIHGLDTYVVTPQPSETASPSTTTTTPTAPQNLLIIIPDAFGSTIPNIRLLADRYSTRTNTTVYLPDFMLSRPVPAWGLSIPMDDMLQNWTSPKSLIMKPWYIFWTLWAMVPFMVVNRFSRSYGRVKGFFEKVRKEQEGGGVDGDGEGRRGRRRMVGAVGFCWGGKHVFLLAGETVRSSPADGGDEAGEETTLIDFGFTAHPSSVLIPEEIDKLKVPVSVAMGTEDFVCPLKVSNRMKELLEGKKEGDPAEGSEFVFYEGANHGFACRGNMKDEKVRGMMEGVVEQLGRWVERMVGRG
ncbi:hypothetical protein ABW19_dt0206597 [Dactylella cylindrospora]|nr:hypothetical protein ABW19_dt0206597 [Dactylella cylindrospora]